MAIESEKPSKRTTNPGVRVIGGRIYDSSNGKTCHQCRQKTMDFVASCKAMNKNKTCPINYCHKCLINRYGENAEEVAKLDNWICPKCRDNCNCSFCMKKRGLNPTGILAHKAKASGLSSVSQLLELEGSDKFTYQKKPKLDDVFVESVSETEVEVTDVAKENKMVGKNKRKLKEETQFEDENVVKEMKTVTDKNKKKPKEEIQFEAKLPQDVTKEKRKVKEEIQFEAKLPQGISLSSVSGIVVPTEEAGNVCQFFEFCLAFGKVLDLKEGRAETVVRELFLSRRNTKRQQYCSSIQMMIQLLEFISQDREMSLSLNETNSNWFSVLGELLLQSEVLGDEFPPETFETEYEKMESSRRLKLLNFLCDESLNTCAMRNYIKSQSDECEEQKKEAKQKAAAAKEKEKQLKQKIQSDVAKAIMEKKGAPLSIEEHNSILSQIRAEAKEAHDEMMEAKGITSRTTLIYDALRTEPIVNDNGLVLWKLKCYEDEPNILLQDLGTFGDLCPHEKWFAFTPQQKLEIEEYISSKRMKLMQT